MLNPPVAIDIIILSYAKNDELKALTQQTISTLLASENESEIKFNVLVIESNKALAPLQFEGSRTIYPSEPFGFNRYLNIGVQETTNEYVCFCNNDLIFHKNWASELIKVMQKEKAYSAAPFCPVTHIRDGYPFDAEVLPIYHVFSGWCFMVNRAIFDIIGPFDEKYRFWYADTDYINLLKQHDITNFMVNKSRVTHLGSKTSLELSEKVYNSLTAIPNAYHNYKWGHKNYFYYLIKRTYLTLSYKARSAK